MRKHAEKETADIMSDLSVQVSQNNNKSKKGKHATNQPTSKAILVRQFIFLLLFHFVIVLCL